MHINYNNFFIMKYLQMIVNKNDNKIKEEVLINLNTKVKVKKFSLDEIFKKFEETVNIDSKTPKQLITIITLVIAVDRYENITL